ncbi:MAG: hypothetical protein ACREEP_07925, partial [Dongiaceae bacterium]
LTPIVGKVIDEAKVTARELALDAGFVDPATCVVTSLYAVDCADHAFGTPLHDALSKMQSQEAELATEKRLRAQAEQVARQAAAEIERLRTQDATSMLGATPQQANRVLPPSATDLAEGTPKPNGDDFVHTTVARIKPSEDEDVEEDQSYFPTEQSEAQ